MNTTKNTGSGGDGGGEGGGEGGDKAAGKDVAANAAVAKVAEAVKGEKGMLSVVVVSRRLTAEIQAKGNVIISNRTLNFHDYVLS